MIAPCDLTEQGIKELIQEEQARLLKASQFGMIANTKAGLDLIRELEEFVTSTKEMYGRIDIGDPTKAAIAFSYVRGGVSVLEDFISRVRDWKSVDEYSKNLISSYRKELEHKKKQIEAPDRVFGKKGT